MPKSHREYGDWPPSRIVSWAKAKEPDTCALVQKILERKQHPEVGHRSCMGIIRLAEKYPAERVEAAAKRAVSSSAISYQIMRSILEKGLDRLPLSEAPAYTPPAHSNIRGGGYYAGEASPDPEEAAKRSR